MGGDGGLVPQRADMVRTRGFRLNASGGMGYSANTLIAVGADTGIPPREMRRLRMTCCALGAGSGAGDGEADAEAGSGAGAGATPEQQETGPAASSQGESQDLEEGVEVGDLQRLAAAKALAFDKKSKSQKDGGAPGRSVVCLENSSSGILADRLGNLFQKERVLTALLEKKLPPGIAPHVKKMSRDLREVRISCRIIEVRGSASASGTDGAGGTGTGSSSVAAAKFVCPLNDTGNSSELDNGTTRSCVLWTCGCVLSVRSVRELATVPAGSAGAGAAGAGAGAWKSFAEFEGVAGAGAKTDKVLPSKKRPLLCPNCGTANELAVLLAPGTKSEVEAMEAQLPSKLRAGVDALKAELSQREAAAAAAAAAKAGDDGKDPGPDDEKAETRRRSRSRSRERRRTREERESRSESAGPAKLTSAVQSMFKPRGTGGVRDGFGTGR